MKKIFGILLLASVVTIVSCGPSAKEKAAAEQARLDSIAAVKEQARLDSIAVVLEQARLDSIAKAEAEAAAAAVKGSKQTTKPKPATTPEEVKPARRGDTNPANTGTPAKKEEGKPARRGSSN